MKTTAGYLLISVILLLIVGAGASRAQDAVIEDRDVKLVSFVDMVYPVNARSAKVQGVVVVKVMIDHEGRVVSASAVSGAKAIPGLASLSE